MSNMTLIVLIVLALVIIWMVTNFIINKRSVTELNQEEFQEGIRKAQVIDLREKADYDYGHIIGARNIPMTMFRQRYQGLRKDQPIYLVDANGIASYRVARTLKKKGYTNLYMLKGGYKKWTGKIKSKK
ncbi:rhodanese-like domain-containing protein [Staphylococcus pseudintermedius]|uniref:Rhodanese-like domain-containing protein n=2 Tax=Staphylococcus pseudintermedius TaxID=283734 RepID=A0A7T7NZY8_STAPS|nr:rhodanese-like domain-containing protein [Staphylococcus pseudintermedius]EHT1795960.1 rhodanese-like domain-containing protein [Staphylococcus pseudintermedius]MDK3755122.1 rhodanese-like domain-containing protein [Staphylococcus pseudintermedius]QQM97010.1 rhodanese-like domain-containing protein [Staphylococcus pseudintermedius]QQM99146.1 rhodanese-like domain-containing protein [Staphylococcus pseudintermedius]UDV06086.1 rhodanese-like domain-containing protein [Staphylococcus pseudinte